MTSSQKRYWRGVIAAQFFTSHKEPYADEDFEFSTDGHLFSQGYHDGIYGTFPTNPSGSGYWDLAPHQPRQEDSEYAPAQEEEHRLIGEGYDAIS